MKSSIHSFASWIRIGVGIATAAAIGLSIHLASLSAQTPGQVPLPIPGRNINMVSGTTLPGGDPFLQRQNEPSIAVSTRNPLHILGAANDYRTVDIPGLGEEVIGDAWIGIFKSFDGGSTWKSSLLPGFRQDASPEGQNSPLYGLEAGADPVLRAGTHGLFYMAGMAFNRDQDAGRVFVARYIDNNNLEAGDSISYLNTSIVDIGTADRFLDKPWVAVDIPRAMKGRGRDDKDDKNDRAKYKDKKDKDFRNQDNSKNAGIPRRPNNGPVCAVPGQAQPIPAGVIYVVYSAFLTPQVQQQAADPNRVKTPRERELEREERMFGKKKNREEWEERRPGQPVEGRTKIMLARSDDCGATFSRPQQISERSQINQGAVMAIDPNNGDLYVAWREFMSSRQPDAILVTKSSDFGRTFSSPVTVARIDPFDQGTTATSFRTNSYPAMTIDGTGRVYIAWAQRGIGPGSDARIVLTSSVNGRNWSAPVPADNHAGRGHQIMPVLNFGGGKLHLVFWDQRDDVSRMWGEFIDEFPIVNWTGDPRLRPRRHTLDLRAVSAWPGAPPTWGPSVKVSNYLEGVLPGSTQPVQLQYNAPNLPLFGLGTKPFIGDYLDVTLAPSFIANGDGTWRFNTQLSDPAAYFTSWGDNRDVRPPRDGNWVHYTPPTFAGYTGTSIYDPTQPVEICSAGQAGMRDQNVYSARVSGGLIVSTPGNNKPLGFVTNIDGVRRLIQRSFVVTVTNTENEVKSITLHISAQPPGGVASFQQFEPLFDLPVDIAAKSSISREVYVTSTDVRATVPITVTEGTSGTASARLFFNPDPTNPDIDNPDIDNPDIDNPDIDNAEAHNITVSNPSVFNPDIDNIARANPDIDNPDIDNPDIDNKLLANLAILNPDIDNPDIDNPDIDNVDIVNPDIDNPDIDNPDIDNAALTDVTWNVSNVGNTATAYQVKLLLKQAQQQRLLNAGVRFQLIVTKTTAAPSIDRCAVVEPNRNLTIVTINSPSFVDPSNAQQVSTVINPDIDNPDIDNATMALAPGDTARVTLRVYSPIGDTTVTEGSGVPDPLDDLTGALEDLRNLGVATSAHAVDTNDVIAGSTTPQIQASIPFIITNRLDDATRTLAYVEQIEQTGSAPPFNFALVTGSLPLGLTLNADGTISGTPQLAGSSTFTVRLTDSNEGTASVTLSIRVFEPVLVVPGVLPGASINQPYATSLAALGGFSPFGWSLTGGALPAGVTLTPAGSLTGTPTQSGSFNFVAMAMDTADPARAGSGAFSLTVTAAPNGQSVNVVEDTATPITVTATGTGPFTFAIGNQPAHGTLTGTGPIFTYTPDLNYNGPDSFTFSATQNEQTSSFATVSITVTPVNDAPIATPKTVNTPQGVAIPIVLTGTDPENNPLTFSIFSTPTTGTLSGTAPNVTYTPPAGFTGTATFQFRANDGVVFSTPGLVSVIVGPPPANSADVRLTLVDAPDPVALGGVITYTATISNVGPATATGVALTLSYPDADLFVQSVTPSQGACVSGVSITCTIGSVVNGGNATVTVAMRAFNRGGTFNVTSTVAGTLLDYNTTNNAAVQSTVVSGPATPTADLQVSQTRLPNPVDFGSNVVYTIVVTNNGPSDATGVSLTNTFTSNTAQFVGSTTTQGSCAPTPGRLTCSVGDLVGGASATIALTLRANGGGSLSNTAVVAGSQADPNAANNTNTLATTIANRTPIATNDSATTNEDVSGTFMVLLNDTDADNDTLTVTSVGTAAHGTTQVSGANSVQYSPAANYFGPDSFTYQISDGHGGVATATVNVNVLAVNDAPSFTRGADHVAGQNTGVHSVPNWATAISTGPLNESGQLVNFVVSNDHRAFFSVQPAVSPTGTLTFTPAAVAQGVANVTVTVLDDGGTDNGGFDSSASQTFTITISAAGATTYVVTNTSDAGAGSLRAAIENANANPAADTIEFNIEGEAPFVIQPASVLPAISDAVTIDATTQPGFSGTPLIDIDGVNAGEVSGLTLAANNSLIRGLIVRRFANDGIIVTGTDNVIAGNYVGTDGSGSVDHGNGRYGISLLNGPNRIGGLSSERNTISNNAQGGVVIGGATPANNTIVQLNTITNNSGFGVHVALGNNNWITRNTIFGNGGLGIDLNPLGVTPNDESDVDTGANNLQNFPVLTSATTTAGTTLVIGQFLSTPNATFTIELFANTAGDPSGHGEAQQFMASFQVTTNPSGVTSFGSSFTALAPGTVFSATATDATGNTSEFGTNAIVAVVEPNVTPSFVAGPSQTVPEDSGLRSVPGWATSISAGPPSEADQTLNFIVSNDNAALFSTQPAIAPNGTLTFTPAANASGLADVSVQLHDNGGGTDTSATQEFTITITPVNDAPSFTAGPSQTVVEDAALQTVPNWATAISAGPPNESGQLVDFIVTNDNSELFLTQPSVSSTGTLTYRPAANAIGVATVTVRAHDNGGTTPGIDTSAPQTFTITVSAINNAPSFTAGPSQTIAEDAALQTVPAWATSISAGPPNESDQLVDFVVTNDNAALFLTQPSVSPTGTLSYRPAANAFGVATVTVRLHDNGGGTDTSAPQTFAITVTPGNDAPSFTAGPSQTVPEDAALQTVPNWATAISAGPPNESAQLVDFIVTNDNTELFLTQPALSSTGTLTYRPAANASGVATVTVRAHDNGGTTPGIDTSAPQTFTITVTTGNSPPVADGRSVATQEDVLVSIALTGSDPDGDPLSFSIVAQPAQGLLTGSPPNVFYTPFANYNGPDAFTFNVSDRPAVASIPGLVSRWPFDGTPSDTVDGNSPFDTAGLSYVVGRVDRAATLATGGFVDVADAANLRLQTLTVSAWVMPQGPNTTADQFGDNIISKWTLNGSGAGSVALTWRASDGRFVLVVNSLTPTVISTDGFAQGVFHHVAATYDGAVARLYVNGQPQGQTPLVTVIPYDTQRWVIGSSAFRGLAFDRKWNGAIDDLRIYSRALTSTEIGQLASEAVSATATVAITVTPANDAPSFVAGANQSATSNGVQQTVVNWATSITAGPANESGQVVDFLVSNNNTALFSTQPAIAANGTLTYTPTVGGSGTATVTVRLHDNGGAATGVDTSAPQTFTITTSSIPNAAPSFTAGPSQTVAEDAPLQTVANWATSISAGPPSESGQLLNFIVSNDNNGLFAGQPAIGPGGALSFLPASNANGSATVTVQLHDNGGTANTGVDTSAPQTFTITVTPVNDPPQFSLPSGLYTAPFNGGPQTVSGWVTAISAGPANEVSQQVTFLVTNDNATAFAVQPAISATGTLTFTLASGETSPTTVTVRAQDNGGGTNTSAPLTFIIGVATANNADLQVSIDDSADPVAPGAQYSYSVAVQNNGPATATGVLFTINVSSNVTVNSIGGPGVCEQTGAGQFTCGTGTLVSGEAVLYGIATSASFGTATATASVSSSVTDPIPANNSATESTVINRPPTAVADNATTDSGVAVYVDVLDNDTDPDSTLGEVFQISAIGGATHGLVTVTSPFVRYKPNPGFTGIDTFTYTLSDAAGAVSQATVTVLVTQAICVAEPSDLISWWPGRLDVNASDIRGGNAGTPQGNVQTAPGFVGTAFSFDRSSGSGIRVPHAANLNPTANQITMAAWVKPAAAVIDYQAIVGKSGSYALSLNNNAFAMCEIGNAPPVIGGSVQVGEWSHVACTYNGATTTLYVDGLPVAIANNELGIPLNTNALMIGGVSTAPSNEFNGLIDEVQIFNRALPIQDILTIVFTGDAGLCEEEAAAVIDDSFVVTSDTTATINPSSNDRDTGAAFPSVLAAVRGLPVGTPQLWNPGDIGVVNSTGLAYFGGGVSSPVSTGTIGVLNTNTNTIVGTIAMPVFSTQSLARVNQTTNIVYLRGTTTLTAVDGRPGSPTFNQVILSMALGAIQSMALDEVRGRLYLTSSTVATSGSLFNSRFVVVDVNPASPTFHQVVDQIVPPGGGLGFSVAVNTVTNRVYAAVNGGTASGVYALDVATNTWTLVPLTTNPSTLIVNDAANLVYAVSGTSLYAIDGASNTRLAVITLPASGSVGTIDTRLALHRPSGHVYVRLSEYPSTSRLAIIDGNRASATFNTILTMLPIGREDGTTMVAVDEVNNRVIATSRTDLRTTVINATTNAVVGNTQSTLPDNRVIIDAAHHRAYIVGGVTTIRSIDVTAGTLQAVLQVATEISAHTVNTQNHTAYVPQTTTGVGVVLINQTGLAGAVPLPHVDGREVFAIRNRVTNRIYALNSGATAAGGSDGLPGFVHVIDGAANNLLASVPAGAFPFGLGINEVTNKIYVGNASSGSVFAGGITVIDGVTHATVQADMSQIPSSSATPGQISIGRDMVPNTATGKLYFRVISGSNVTLGVLDGTTNVATPLADDNELIGIVKVNPVLNKVYVGAQETAADPTVVYVLDGTNEDLLAAVEVGSPTPFVGTQSYLAVNITTGRVFVADYEHDKVDVLDGTTNAIVATIAVGDGPSTVAVNETLNRIYIGNALDKTLTIIDGNTMRVAATLSLPLAPVRLEVDESVSQIFAMSSLIEPGIMVIDDPGTIAPAINSVTNGGAGTTVLNANGSVTYTPNAGYVGDDTFTYTIPDGLGGFSTGTVHVTVASPLTITTVATLPAISVGQVYPGVGLTVIGGTAPYYWSITSGQLPAGLALNSATASITGAPVQSGTYTFTAQARDSSNPPRVVTKVFTINVGPPVIVTSTLPTAFIGEAYSAGVVVGGATGAVSWAINTNNNPLLSWLSISNAGVLTGTPPAVGSAPVFTVTATDSLNQVASRQLSFFVSGPLDVEPLREGVVLETQPALSIIGGNGTRAVTVTSGALPPGLTLTSAGVFNGVPTRHGTYNFTLELRDCSPLSTCNGGTQQVVSKNLTLRVSAKDQQGSSQTQPAISFGGAGGRRMAQIVTMGATGTLTGVGLQNITCPSVTPLTVLIQRLTVAGLPDGTSIATGTATSNYNAISVTPTVNMPIGEKFAFIVSSPVACTFINAATIDQYNAGDAYVDAGSGWVSLFSTDGRYDIPSFRTLLQPAMGVGYLTNARANGSTATLLANGTVLMTGTGASAEIYNPATNSTTLTGNMSTARTQHTATLLQNGTVLIVGGQTGGVRIATAETYDPVTGTFSLTAGPASVGRDVHAATRMNDGRVLITGGNINLTPTTSTAVATAEIYDPVSRTFSAAPNMTGTRQQHNSILLQSGRVLVASGFISGTGVRSAELYDPAANTFTGTVGNMLTTRGLSAAETLADGRVLFTGGQSGLIQNTAEIYNPVTDTFTTVGAMATPRYQHTTTLLADGTVLVAGGFDEITVASYVLPLASVERFNPATNSFTPAGAMEARRARHNAIRLPNNTVFLAGGAGQSWMTGNTADIYDAPAAPSLTTTTVPVGQVGVAYPATTLQATGGSGAPYQIAVVSGVLPPGLTLNAAFTLSGTPTANGVFQLGIRVTDSLNHITVEALTIYVGAPFVITTPYQLAGGALTHPYDVQLTASAASVWSLAPASGIMPLGLVLGADGRITGTPTEAINRTFSARAVDALGRSALKTFNISISNPLDITTTVLPEAAVKENYNFCMSSTNGVTSNTWSVVGGTMPPGVTLLANGCFSSPPTALGTFNPQVRVTDLASPPQVVTRNFTIRVSAKDQEGGSQTQPVISFGGAGGRRLAQTVTVGANGTLTAFGFNSTTNCAAPVTVDVQRLDGQGRPDGATIASGSLLQGLGGIAISPAVNFGIGDRLAFVLSSTGVCTIANVPATSDIYQAGDGWVDAGSGWTSLFATDGRYDIPFRTMITPATEVAFMNRGRNSFGATVLNDGRVLLTSNGNPADIYDPVTRTITPTGNMITPRSNHTATVLADGTVLLAGGRDVNSVQLTTAEIYNPVTGTFTQTTGSLTVPHEDATATRLNDGRVFIAGGRTLVGAQTQSIPTTEIYDPVSRTFTFAGNMLTDRHRHTAALLNDGRVILIAGFTGGISGSVTRSAEIYNPITGTFTATVGSMANVRGGAASARLADGRILVTGGQSGDLVNTAEIYNPGTDSFTTTGAMLSRHYLHTATTLADGSVLIAGGYDEVNASSYILPLGMMERFLPASGTFVPAGGMATRRAFHAAALLQDGRVLLAGGSSQSWMSGNTVELYDPLQALALSPAVLPNAQPGVAYTPVTLVASGGTGPYQISMVSGALPSGMTYNATTFVLAGTPAANVIGTFTLGIQVTDNASHRNVQTLELNVGAINTITDPYRLPDARVGVPYSLQLSATGPGPITWLTGPPSSLPPGLVLNAAGLISGTPTTQNFHNFAVRAVDAAGRVAIKTLSISVTQPMSITTTSLSDNYAGQTYFACFNNNNGTAPFTWSITGLSGASFSAGSNCLNSAYPNGTIRQAGTFTFTVSVTDSSSTPQMASRDYTVTFHAQDQFLTTELQPNISLPATRRVAQVIRAASPYPMTGVQLWSLQSCTPNTQITAAIRPITAMRIPDESGAPLATTTTTVNSSGGFNNFFVFASPLAVPQHAYFAVVVSFANGSCIGANWPTGDFYQLGEGWVDDGGGWQRTSTALGRSDVGGITTFVMPDSTKRFLQNWRPSSMSVTLADGRVLYMGNDPTAEIYDPVTNTVTPTANNMSVLRSNATATLLGNGRVLIAGGSFWDGTQSVALATSEIFNPATGTFSAGASMPDGRWGHTATALADGRVLISGGWTISGATSPVLSTAVVYASTGLSAQGVSMTGARVRHSATRLADGRVLIAGGWTGLPFPPNSAEIYDPSAGANGTFTSIGNAMIGWPSMHTGTLITSGTHANEVLIAGGVYSWPDISTQTQYFNPATSSFSAGPSMLVGRYDTTALRLADGRIMFGGGSINQVVWAPTAHVEFFNPAFNGFVTGPSMAVDQTTPALYEMTTGVNSGKVSIVAGGGSSVMAGRMVEFYDPSISVLRIATLSLPSVGANGAYSATLSSLAGTGTGYTYAVVWGRLPIGLTLTGDTISGVAPNFADLQHFVIRVSDSGSNTAYRAFSIAVAPLTITTPAELPPGLTNTNYSHQLNYTGGVGTVVWELIGSLPPGFSMSPSGLITGISSSPVNWSVAIKATDSAGTMRNRTFFITINNPIDFAASVQFAVADDFCAEAAGLLQ